MTLCSSTEKHGIDKVWSMIGAYYIAVGNDWIGTERENQNVDWMHESISYLLKSEFYESKSLKKELELMENKIRKSEITPFTAARQLTDLR